MKRFVAYHIARLKNTFMRLTSKIEDLDQTTMKYEINAIE